MWSDLEAMVTNLAATFWTHCNLSSSQDGKLYKIELQIYFFILRSIVFNPRSLLEEIVTCTQSLGGGGQSPPPPFYFLYNSSDWLEIWYI